MKTKLYFSFLLTVGALFAADNANDLILVQRKPDNSNSTQRNLAPAANSLFGFNGSMIPADVAVGTGLILSGNNLSLDSSANGRAILTAADYASMRSLLSLGTSALLDVASSGNASSGQVVKGSDTRLTDTRTPTSAINLAAGGSGGVTGTLPIASGGTGGATAAAAIVNLTPASVLISGTNVDWSAGTSFYKTLAANTTLTFSNSSDGQSITLLITNTASNYTLTLPTISWPSGAPPTLTPGAHTDMFNLANRGGTIYGNYVQNY